MQSDDPSANGVSGRSLELLVADDHEAARAGLRLALVPRGFTIAAEAPDAESALDAALRVRPDVCLIATHLPGGGIRAAADIHARASEVAVVMLATVADEADLFAALDAGAAGYLLKDIEPGALERAVRAVERGEAALPRALVASVFAEFRARGRAGAATRRADEILRSLTRQQTRVLELLSEGVGTVEIGDRLAISPTTVRRHVSSIVRRLGVDDRAAAAAAYRAVLDSPAGPTRSDPPGRGGV